MTHIVTRKDILEGLRALSISQGDILLVHSSLKSFGQVEGGADAVIDALLEAVGAEGTVMVPTITCRREHSPQYPPVLDIRQTSCWTGIIPETFRKRPEAVRSLSPTHSVAAIGARAHQLLDDHIRSYTPCDEHSPYQKNAALGGKILFLGVDQKCNTTLHACEEIAAVPYHLQKEETKCLVIDAAGGRHEIINRLHSWEGPERNFPIIEQDLINLGVLKKTKTGPAIISLLDAARTIDYVVGRLRKDSSFLCQNNIT